ncbi:myrosinase 1-like [Schistocerca americana]|uniref:myrosinase 1-like n=1 Tax=Schistocerca americana TaxID=7009 RepID=UPI001F4F8878|nr:myrosinase 1-like [Schistocerca americana]XP_047122093.1 myrosinase 1-like [Schistocerca piceifrons]
MLTLLIVLSVVLTVGSAQTNPRQFPEGFLLGTATAAYQVEGGWNADGKGESIQDVFFHNNPELTAEGDNGDVACDSYHKYKEDVQMLKALNADVYRFSISWSRVLPNGDLDVINQAGIDYYNNLINELLANGIQPVVTMYHWDLPQALQYIGGWANELMADYFVEYARLLFENFGDRVKWWITFNEPSVFVNGYSYPLVAPAQTAPGIGDYLATHTVIKSHARVWHLYDEEYRASQNGSVGITINMDVLAARSNSTEDLEASERARQFQFGIFAHPIFTEEGDYPAVVRQRIDANSAAEGRPRSRLPSFTQEEVEYIRGSADFLGLNNYWTNYAYSIQIPIKPSKIYDSGVITITGGRYPWGFRELLNWVANEYPGYPIFVTENGLSNSGGLNDTDRIEYFIGYMGTLLEAIYTDNIPVIGYTIWSLMDTLEWRYGFTRSYGLYDVDTSSPNRTRTPKDSAAFISQVYGSRQVPEEYIP